jgi:hypothetical protein
LASEQKSDAVSAVNEALDNYGVTCAIPSGDTGTLSHGGQTSGTCTVRVAACPSDTAHNCVSVSLAYDYRDHSLLPSFPGLGIVLPRNLTYTASARVS